MPANRPNILLAISDDQGWPHAGAYGCKFVNTPAFDRVAAEGVLFDNAFCPAPQCSPARASLLTGLNPWQLEEGCLLWSLLPAKYDVYPDLLEEAGYFVGLTNKGWGPGSDEQSGRSRNPAGPQYNKRRNAPPAELMSTVDYAANFADVLDDKPEGQPFCFWYGAKEPHRRYEKGSGLRAGKRLQDVVVPPHLPDCDEVRSDFLDYGLAIDWFDTHLGRMMELIEQRGELDNTIIVVTGDNGFPFPRAKANLYENGLHVPLAIRWPERVPAGRVVTDFVSFTDLAPTFLDAAGVAPRQPMTGRSVMDVLGSDQQGRVDPTRNVVLTCRERHAYCRPDNLGYPCRCIKTDDYLYIRNYTPDRWPAGDPEDYADADDGPSKEFMIQHRDDDSVKELFRLAFDKRPEEELYAAGDGPSNMRNLAADPAHAQIKDELRTRMEAELAQQRDPRMHGRGWIFDTYPYYGRIDGQFPGFKTQSQYNLDLVPPGENVDATVPKERPA